MAADIRPVNMNYKFCFNCILTARSQSPSLQLPPSLNQLLSEELLVLLTLTGLDLRILREGVGSGQEFFKQQNKPGGGG